MATRTAQRLVVMGLTLFLLSCALQPPSSSTSADVYKATQALALVELGVSVVTNFLTTAQAQGLVSASEMATYTTTIAPAVQQAFDDATSLLRTMQATPNATTAARLTQAMTTVEQAFGQAVAFATAHGYLH